MMFCVTPLVKFHLVVGQAIYVLVVFLLLQNVIIDALVAYVRKTIKKKIGDLMGGVQNS